MRRFLWLVPLVAAFIVGGILLFKATPDAQLGRPAPSFSLPLLGNEDQRVTLERFAGRPVVLNFWASWCEPCKQEAPEFARVAREFESDVAFLGVTILDGRSAAQDFVKAYDIPYDSVRDVNGSIAKRFKVAGAPETMFIDARGRLVGKFIGNIGDGQLEPLVRQLLSLPKDDVMDITGSGESQPVP